MLLILILLQFACLLTYFRVATRFGIVDKPNRGNSSHAEDTIRGAGIIFPIGILLYYFFNPASHIYFLIALLLLSVIHFLDDLKHMSISVRMITHAVCVVILFYQVELPGSMGWYVSVLMFILSIGTLNAMNFMDGINGNLVLACVITLLSLLYINVYEQTFIDTTFLLYSMTGLLVFGIFNLRKRAKCFAGDVGSVSIAFILLYALLLLIIKTQRIEYMFMLSWFGIDFCITLATRILYRQNILQPHRNHLYQHLVHRYKWSHLSVAAVYMVVQGIINILVIKLIIPAPQSWTTIVCFLAIISGIYILVKKQVTKGSERLATQLPL